MCLVAQKRLWWWMSLAEDCALDWSNAFCSLFSLKLFSQGKDEKEKMKNEKVKMQPAIVCSFYLLISLWIWLFSCKKLMPFAVPWTILHLIFQGIGGVSSLIKKRERQVKIWKIYIHSHKPKETYKNPTTQKWLFGMFCCFQVDN